MGCWRVGVGTCTNAFLVRVDEVYRAPARRSGQRVQDRQELFSVRGGHVRLMLFRE